MGHGHEPSAPSVASPVTEHNNKTTVPQSVDQQINRVWAEKPKTYD